MNKQLTPAEIEQAKKTATAYFSQEAKDNEAFLRESDTPSLERLSYVLKHPETWPPGFQWDFSFCDTCALGLAREMFDLDFACSDNVAKAIGISHDDAYRIFIQMDGKKFPWYKMFPGPRDVTPQMVAKQLDEIIAKRKA